MKAELHDGVVVVEVLGWGVRDFLIQVPCGEPLVLRAKEGNTELLSVPQSKPRSHRTWLTPFSGV